MDNFWIAIITPVATVICNAIYFGFVKRDIDTRLEQYKITYSGIFKEKLEHYKHLLTTMDDLKDMVVKYGNAGDQSDISPYKIMDEINRFIRFYEFGSIFYTKEIEDIVQKIRVEFQDVLDTSIMFHNTGGTDKKFTNYFIKLRNLVNGKDYYSLKKELIKNIRQDFGLESKDKHESNISLLKQK